MSEVNASWYLIASMALFAILMIKGVELKGPRDVRLSVFFSMFALMAGGFFGGLMSKEQGRSLGQDEAIGHFATTDYLVEGTYYKVLYGGSGSNVAILDPLSGDSRCFVVPTNWNLQIGAWYKAEKDERGYMRLARVTGDPRFPEPSAIKQTKRQLA